MKTLKKIGYVGLASAALLALTPSLTVAATPQEGPASSEGSNNLVHRVSHTLASAEQYTGSASSGYKWGKQAPAAESKAIWAGSREAKSGYKWGNSSVANESVISSANADYAKQTRSKWRRDFTEQSRSKWRRDFSEQA